MSGLEILIAIGTCISNIQIIVRLTQLESRVQDLLVLDNG